MIVLRYDHNRTPETNDLSDYLIDRKRFTKDDVVAANSNPCNFLLYYIQKSLQSAMARMNTLEFLSETSHEHNLLQWEDNLRKYRRLIQSKRSLSRTIQRASNDFEQEQSPLNEVIQDYTHIIGDVKEDLAQQHQHLQSQASHEAIAEARKSLEQADAVRRWVTWSMDAFSELPFLTELPL